MKSLIVSTQDSKGGASIAAFRLHKSLLNFEDGKIQSSMLVKKKNRSEENIFCSKSLFDQLSWRAKSFLSSKINLLQKSENKVIHSTSFLPCNLHKFINSNDSKIVNLHWVQSEMLSIESIGRIKKPIVWTLHDCWPFSGSEHYPNDLSDKRYQEGYFRNNKLKSSKGIDIDKWCWERKLKSWKNPMHIVCPSKWMESCVKNSFLMKDWPTYIIANPLPTDIYRSWPKDIARKLFKLPKEKFLIMFSSLDTKDQRKGYELLLSALKILFQKSEIDFEVIILGKYEKNSIKTFFYKQHYIDALHDDQSIAMLYSAADLMIVPSKMENLPQSATEAQSCGLPVVGFDCSGMNDVVTNKKTGLLVKPYDTKELAEAINYLILNPTILKSFSKNARNFAVKNWSEDVIAEKYQKLFIEIFKNYY